MFISPFPMPWCRGRDDPNPGCLGLAVLLAPSLTYSLCCCLVLGFSFVSFLVPVGIAILSSFYHIPFLSFPYELSRLNSGSFSSSCWLHPHHHIHSNPLLNRTQTHHTGTRSRDSSHWKASSIYRGIRKTRINNIKINLKTRNERSVTIENDATANGRGTIETDIETASAARIDKAHRRCVLLLLLVVVEG